MANERLTALAQSFRALKDRKEELEAELKTVNEELTDMQVNQLPKAMDDNEVEKFTVAGVGTIYQQVKVYANVKADDREAFHEDLRSNGFGDLIKETVWPQTLMSFAKEQLEQDVDLNELFHGRLTALKVPTAMLRRK